MPSVPLLEQSCPCRKCSWGFCHHCDTPTNTVADRLDGKGYAYLTGCGKALVATKVYANITTRYLGSYCPAHAQAVQP